MIFEGKNFMDIRGNLNAINDFNFKNIKRFYHIKYKNNTIKNLFFISSGK